MLFILAFAIGIGVDIALADTERTLTNKTVLITGAGKGIGRCIADKLLEEGVNILIIVDKNETNGANAAETLSAKYGDGKAVFIKGDISNKTDLDEISKNVIEIYGCVDMLVNDAGVMDENDTEMTITTNTLGTIEWSWKFFNIMRTDEPLYSSCGKGGMIINLVSLAGYIELPFLTTYIASKFALSGLTISMGHKYNSRQTGVEVVGICPGFTYTDMTSNMQVPEYQKEDFTKFINSMPWQEPTAVANGTIEVYKNAETGTLWEISGGAAPTLAPDRTVVSCEDIDNL